MIEESQKGLVEIDMKFEKYQHVERFGTDEVDGIDLGLCHIFYKIDGTNGSVWMDSGEICCGSRNRELSLDNDNQGFCKFVSESNELAGFFRMHPNVRIYGEWLVPHSLKTYRDDAWRRFYVFDVCAEGGHYVPYETYSAWMEEFGLDYVPALASIKNPSFENLQRFMDNCGQFLVEDGKGKGEGIVIKNYGFYNRFGRQTWAKMVTNEFKEKHHKAMGAPLMNGSDTVEEKIAEEFVTRSFCEKEWVKIKETDGWSSKMIPQLLGRIYYELVREECWNFVKKHNNPTINFKRLNTVVIMKVKTELPEVFG